MKIAELTFDQFLDARTVWDDVLQRSVDNHVFLTWEWLSTWWRFYGDKRRFLLVTVNDDNKILAAAPLMFSTYRLYGLELRKIEFIATPASDYHSFLLTEKKPEHAKMMIEHADRVAPEWGCIELQEIPEDSETARVLRSISKERPSLEERIQNLCPRILLPSVFEGYLRRLGSSWRRNMRRWERKVSRDYKMDFKIHNDIDTVNDAMKTIFDLHQRRWQSENESGAFSEQRFRSFHLNVARSFAERGWLALNFLTLNDEPVAAGYAFKYRQKLFCYLSGFDPQFSEYHVGHLRHIHLIKHCIEQGLKEYDFLRGVESYKFRWNSSIKKNLEVRAIKRKIVPILYDWITKNNKLSPLTYRLGERLSLG